MGQRSTSTPIPKANSIGSTLTHDKGLPPMPVNDNRNTVSERKLMVSSRGRDDDIGGRKGNISGDRHARRQNRKAAKQSKYVNSNVDHVQRGQVDWPESNPSVEFTLDVD